ncbi:hypothetical protein D3C87_944910 [compost metagenome]
MHIYIYSRDWDRLPAPHAKYGFLVGVREKREKKGRRREKEGGEEREKEKGGEERERRRKEEKREGREEGGEEGR